MNAAEAKMHLESAPQFFRSNALNQEQREEMNQKFDNICDDIENLTAGKAVQLAQRILVHALANGIDYSDFQSAQAVEREVKKAVRALSGLSLV